MEDASRRSSPTPPSASSNRRGLAMRGTVPRGPALRSGRLSSCRSPESSTTATPSPSMPSSPRKKLPSSAPSAGKVPAAPTPARQGLRASHGQSGYVHSSRLASPPGVAGASERMQPRLPRRSATVAPACDSSTFTGGSRSSAMASGGAPHGRNSMSSNRSSSVSEYTGIRHARGYSVGTRLDTGGKATVTPATPASARAPIAVTGRSPGSADERSVSRGLDVVLTAKLASRLLADLLEAYRSTDKLEDARAAVGKSWGFLDEKQMTLCIEAQANASYCCTASSEGDQCS